jgi:hypothetical protein
MVFDPKAHLMQLPRKQKDPQTGQWTIPLDDYLEVKWRLVWFRERYPHGTLTTVFLTLDWAQGLAICQATVSDGEGGTATGTGTETRKGFEDFVEKAETRSIGRALAALGIGTQFVGEELNELPHVVDSPVVSTNGQVVSDHRTMITPEAGYSSTAIAPDPLPPGEGEASRLTPDQARELKKLAQTVFGFPASETRLRQDLGFTPEEKLTLRHLAAHVTAAQYQALMEAYTAQLRQEVEADLPDFPPPAVNGQGPTAEPPPDERLRWGELSRRSMQVGLSATTWDALRQGDYAAAERVIVALEANGHAP